MHTIKLNVGDSTYTHLMFLLKDLSTSKIQAVEDITQDEDNFYEVIDMSVYMIKAFKSIQNPLSGNNK